VAPLGFADSLREWQGLVVRHPDYRRIHPRLKPWLSAVGAKLFDQITGKIGLKHYSIRTEQVYVYWVKGFILFHGKEHPKMLGKGYIEGFLSDRIHLVIRTLARHFL